MAENSRFESPEGAVARASRFRVRSVHSVVVLGAMLLFLVVAELGARLYVTRIADDEHFRLYASLGQVKARLGGSFYIQRHHYLGYSGTPDYAEEGVRRHNALGYRGEEIVMPKPAGEFRIACIGSSTTYDDCIEDYRQAYPAMLEKELRDRGYNSTVINAGLSGWSSYEDMIEYALRLNYLQVDLIVVYEAFNDLCLRLVWPPESYRSDNSGGVSSEERNGHGWLFEWSTFLRIAALRAGLIAPLGTVGNAVNQYASTLYANEFFEQATANTYPQGIFLTAPLAKMLAINTPAYYVRNIEHLVAMARQDQVQMLLVTFARSPEAFSGNGQAGQEFLAGLDEMNTAMRDLATRTEAPLFDLARAYPANAAYWSDMIHNNEDGAAIKARLIAQDILDKAMIPKAHLRPSPTGVQTP